MISIPPRPTLLLLGALLLAPGAHAVEIGQRAPDFQAPALGSEGNLSLGAHRGKVVYLDFWASWCPPCLTAMPLIDELRKEFPSDDFQVLAVNVDNDPNKALKLLRKRPVGYPSATDPKGRLPETFEIGTMPTSFLIDRQGVVRYVHEGFRSGDVDVLREHIRELLAAAE